jgi:hypothetical protein
MLDKDGESAYSCENGAFPVKNHDFKLMAAGLDKGETRRNANGFITTEGAGAAGD